MSGDHPTYQSYLLRLWRAHTGEQAVWHASLEDPHTGERRGFADLGLLVAFLEQRLGVDEHARHQPRDERITWD